MIIWRTPSCHQTEEVQNYFLWLKVYLPPKEILDFIPYSSETSPLILVFGQSWDQGQMWDLTGGPAKLKYHSKGGVIDYLCPLRKNILIKTYIFKLKFSISLSANNNSFFGYQTIYPPFYLYRPYKKYFYISVYFYREILKIYTHVTRDGNPSNIWVGLRILGILADCVF